MGFEEDKQESVFFLYLRKQKEPQHNGDIQVETKVFKKAEEMLQI